MHGVPVYFEAVGPAETVAMAAAQSQEPTQTVIPTSTPVPTWQVKHWTRDEVLRIDLLLRKHVEGLLGDAYPSEIGGSEIGATVGEAFCAFWREVEYDYRRLDDLLRWLNKNDKESARVWTNAKAHMDQIVVFLYEVSDLDPATRRHGGGAQAKSLLTGYCAHK